MTVQYYEIEINNIGEKNVVYKHSKYFGYFTNITFLALNLTRPKTYLRNIKFSLTSNRKRC